MDFRKIARLSEDEKENRAFAKAFRDKFYKDGKWKFSEADIKSLEGFPEKLDLENNEVHSVGNDYVCFVGGGDWQASTYYDVVLKTGRLQVKPFEYHEKDDTVSGLKELLELASS